MNPTKQNTMEAIRLISMTDFVIRKYKDELVHSGENWRDSLEKYARITKSYADFLKRPLKLEMFVPCDENGNVLDPSDAFRSCEKGFVYSKAKERVLFKGFNCNEDLSKLIHNDLNLVINVNFLEFKNMEELAKYKLELTPTAIKQIGL